MKNSRVSAILSVISLLLVSGAVLTLIPFSGASKPGILGYRAVCPFSPVSTVMMLFIAYSINGYRKKLKKQGQ